MDKLAELTEAYEKLGEEIEALKTPVPWEPTEHTWTASFWHNESAALLDAYPENDKVVAVQNGRTYPTREAAEKASLFFHFYQRIYALAFEMNQKHTDHPIDNYCVVQNRVSKKWTMRAFVYSTAIVNLFTSLEAAQEAADIMNRDQWTLPTL